MVLYTAQKTQGMEIVTVQAALGMSFPHSNPPSKTSISSQCSSHCMCSQNDIYPRNFGRVAEVYPGSVVTDRAGNEAPAFTVSAGLYPHRGVTWTGS